MSEAADALDAALAAGPPVGKAKEVNGVSEAHSADDPTTREESAAPTETSDAPTVDSTDPPAAAKAAEGDTKTPEAKPPSDAQLHNAIVETRQSESGQALGVPKLLAKLKESNPTWSISEKRLRKYLSQNPTLSTSGPRMPPPDRPSDPLWIPNYVWHTEYESGQGEGQNAKVQSNLDDDILVECKTKKVEPVRFEEANKGSGLIAKEKLVKGALVFKEDAYVWVPGSKNLTKAISAGQACAYCGRLFSTVRHKAQVSCPHHTDHWAAAAHSKKVPKVPQGSKSTQSRGQNSAGGSTVTEKPGGPEPCYQRFCNRVCATKSAETYGPLVCPQMNPEYQTVIGHCNNEDYRAPHLAFKLYAALLMANERGELNENLSPEEAEAKPKADGASPAAEGEAKAEAPESKAESVVDEAEGTAAPSKKSKKGKSKKKASTIPTAPPAHDTISGEMIKMGQRIFSLAQISDRARREKGQAAGGPFAAQLSEIRFGQAWKYAWHLGIRALHLDTGYRPKPRAPGEKKEREGSEEPEKEEERSETDEFWATYWKRRMSPRLIREFFGIVAYLEMLGLAALNQEEDHGIYLLHARINHSCEPNCAVLKHVAGEDKAKSAPSTIFVQAKKDIEPEEEITLAYVQPDLPVELRRKKLYDEYCFSCFCSKCRRELQEIEDAKKASSNTTSSDEEEGESKATEPVKELAEGGEGAEKKDDAKEKADLAQEMREFFSA